MSLRVILAIIGVLILAVILWDGYRHWRKSKNMQKKPTQERVKQPVVRLDENREDIDRFDTRIEPHGVEMSVGEPEIIFDKFDAEPEFDDVLMKPKQTAAQAPQFIMLHLLADEDMGFSAEDLRDRFAAQYLHYGPMHIFHRHQMEEGEGAILFSVANAFEPGTLNLEDDAEFYTSGLTFFMQLPGNFSAIDAFETMLDCASLLADELGAQLCDHKREFLTTAMTQQYRDLAASFERD